MRRCRLGKMIELQCKEIVGSEAGPHLLITGGVHGDEFESMVAIRRLIREVAPAQLRGRLTLVPVVNEAAYLRGTRTADDMLDLARTCPGRADGSVTEQTAHALSHLIRGADYYIDLHSGGIIMSVWPMSGYGLHHDPEVLEVQRRMARAFNLPVIWGTDPNLEGRSMSIARTANVPAIYTEFLGSGLCAPDGVVAYFEGCLNVMGELGMIDRPPPQSRVKYVVEDNRENAGHMQICNPSPVTGLFEPHVQLGNRIESGQPLGEVSDILGDEVVGVNSRETGFVLTLRTFSRVMKGDTLAVIVEDSV